MVASPGTVPAGEIAPIFVYQVFVICEQIGQY
jgi:hypothetical protein